MVCLLVGLAVLLAAGVLVGIGMHCDLQDRRRRAAICQQQQSAERAMVQTVQNTIAEMFEAVRRQR